MRLTTQKIEHTEQLEDSRNAFIRRKLWVLEQFDLMEGVPVHIKEFGTKRPLKMIFSLPNLNYSKIL